MRAIWPMWVSGCVWRILWRVIIRPTKSKFLGVISLIHIGPILPNVWKLIPPIQATHVTHSIMAVRPLICIWFVLSCSKLITSPHISIGRRVKLCGVWVIMRDCRWLIISILNGLLFITIIIVIYPTPSIQCKKTSCLLYMCISRLFTRLFHGLVILRNFFRVYLIKSPLIFVSSTFPWAKCLCC